MKSISKVETEEIIDEFIRFVSGFFRLMSEVAPKADKVNIEAFTEIMHNMKRLYIDGRFKDERR